MIVKQNQTIISYQLRVVGLYVSWFSVYRSDLTGCRSLRHASWYLISASGEVNLAGARRQLILVVDMEPMCRNSFGTCKNQTADRITVGQIVVKQEQYSDQGVACFTNGTNELHLHQPRQYVLLLFTWTVLSCQPNSALRQPRC
jgi:hypothetical protein